MRREDAEACDEGAFLVAGGEEQRRLARHAQVDGLRPHRHHQHAREVLALVGDAAADDGEPVDAAGLLARDRGLRGVGLVAHAARGHCGVGERLDVAVAERRQELAALRQRDRMRRDAPQPRQRHVFERQQAVLHLLHLLADDRQFERREQVEGCRDRAGDRVLDRQQRALHLAVAHRLQHLFERVEPNVRHIAVVRSEMPLRGQVRPGAFAALVTNAQGRAFVHRGGAERRFLQPHRMTQDLLIESRHEEAVEAGLFGARHQARQDLLLARQVAQVGAAFGLETAHLADDAGALGEGVEKRLVDGVEAVAEGFDFRRQRHPRIVRSAPVPRQVAAAVVRAAASAPQNCAARAHPSPKKPDKAFC